MMVILRLSLEERYKQHNQIFMALALSGSDLTLKWCTIRYCPVHLFLPMANAILSGNLAGDYHFQATIPVTNDFSGDFRIFQALFLITVNFSGSSLATVISFPVTSNLSKNSFRFNFLVLITVLL
ncbi:hypothetical protein VNO80_17396 [Phaseolus coccineus]|uniref:Uncharacterized protein n=1 Tax=Phaseolus coccineus TaxID=3886 RepID=A0AAN9MHF5_PHACN